MIQRSPLPWGLGLIEGFYGRDWSLADRLETLGFLARSGYAYYVYAPKSDALLRRQWRADWSPEQFAALQAVAARARSEGLAWGVGLSPLGLVEDMGASALGALRAKIRQLDDLGIDILCVLFDDMPKGVEDLAERQCEVIAEAAACSLARYLLACPSYYSRDPVLERVFGARPENYWEKLGVGIAPEIGLFWTGARVCSKDYPIAELGDIADAFRRKPVLWDNYPVNDGARMAEYLHLDAFRGRSAELATACSAHFVNPMNQCRLSWIPLATLPRVYRCAAAYDPVIAFSDACAEIAGTDGAIRLREDLVLLQHIGLKTLTDAAKSRLRERYGAIAAPWARELLAWVDGEYVFDPACLTD